MAAYLPCSQLENRPTKSCSCFWVENQKTNSVAVLQPREREREREGVKGRKTQLDSVLFLLDFVCMGENGVCCLLDGGLV